MKQERDEKPHFCENNIWFTYKARIRASERLLANDFHSQLLLVWYALINVGLSVFIVAKPNIYGEATNLLMALFALILFALSLIIQNRNFKDRASEFKNNYISLQQLIEECKSENITETKERYYELQRASENHKTLDYNYFRVFSKGHNRPASCWEITQVYFYVVVRLSVLSILYLLPIASLVCAGT